MYLGNKDAMIMELRLDHLFIEGLGVELITWSSFHWISQIAHYDIVLLLPFLQFRPAYNGAISSDSNL